MFQKIKSFIKNFFYSIPFGMEAANNEILYSKNSSNSESQSIQQHIHSNNVFNDMLNMKETQEVKEFRYKMYYISEEAKKYKYYGGDRAKKIAYKNISDSNIISFYQENYRICKSITESINTDIDSQDNTLKIKTTLFPKFRIEKYIDKFQFYANINKNEYRIKFYISKYVDSENIPNKIFVKLLQSGNEKEYEFLKLLDEVSFITKDARNIPDYTKFILESCKLLKIYETEKSIVIEYLVDKYTEDNLLVKFKEKNVDLQYANKAQKSSTYKFGFENENSKKYYCELCGKEINEFETDLSIEKTNRILCLDCLSKFMVIK